jgi:type I restriction enzyme, S subunit
MDQNTLQELDRLPPGWAATRLGAVLPILYGKGLTKGNRDNSGKYPVYGSSGQLGKHSEALTQRPSLILGRKGSVGEVHYSPVPCWPIDTTYYVEESDYVHLKFFGHLLKGLNLSKLDRSTAIPGLSRDDYDAVPSGLPLSMNKSES